MLQTITLNNGESYQVEVLKLDAKRCEIEVKDESGISTGELLFGWDNPTHAWVLPIVDPVRALKEFIKRIENLRLENGYYNATN